MSNSIITQKRIAKEFKRAVIDDGLESVSISSLMKQVGIRRQTFYDYFLDKYDLVAWIFKQEATELIQDNLDYNRWNIIIENLFEHLEANKMFYQMVLSYSGQNAFNKYFKEHIVQLFKDIYSHREHYQTSSRKYNDTEISETLIHIYSNGIVETTIDWILDECQIPVNEYTNNVCYFISQVINESSD